MLKVLAISIMLIFVSCFIGSYIALWVFSWELGLLLTTALGFAAVVNWAAKYLKENL